MLNYPLLKQVSEPNLGIQIINIFPERRSSSNYSGFLRSIWTTKSKYSLL